MRIHKTKYATLTDEDLFKLADQQGFNVTELGIELMERLAYAIETPQDEITDLENEISSLKDEIESLEDVINALRDELDS